MSMKNSNGNIGNRTRDLPACSAVTQPNVPSRAKKIRDSNNQYNNNNNNNKQKHWYEHVPQSAVTNQGGKVTIL
jgi:hypothetical protein